VTRTAGRPFSLPWLVRAPAPGSTYRVFKLGPVFEINSRVKLGDVVRAARGR
jgi:hypothetical protein